MPITLLADLDELLEKLGRGMELFVPESWADQAMAGLQPGPNLDLAEVAGDGLADAERDIAIATLAAAHGFDGTRTTNVQGERGWLLTPNAPGEQIARRKAPPRRLRCGYGRHDHPGYEINR